MNGLILFLHVFGVVVFLGNIIITFFWKLMANRSQNPEVVAFSQKLVTKTDRLFTAAGATLLSVSGYAYAKSPGFSLFESWLLWAQVSFYASAAIWALVLVPIQHKQSKMADEFSASREIPTQYWTLANYWNWIGSVAIALPILSLYFMVAKPI